MARTDDKYGDDWLSRRNTARGRLRAMKSRLQVEDIPLREMEKDMRAWFGTLSDKSKRIIGIFMNGAQNDRLRGGSFRGLINAILDWRKDGTGAEWEIVRSLSSPQRDHLDELIRRSRHLAERCLEAEASRLHKQSKYET